ncbi:MAG: pyruvate kinase [Bacteroidetes bacterium]|nr:pyruvate kinase [Bacteroidota bacterium]MCH8233417.1 pyruvate kinase [Bacteroidota bacterium]
MNLVEFNKTKIIATVGPASNTKKKLKELVNAGTDVFRLNFAHGSWDDHAKVVKYVREINQQLGTTICLLQDLQGPKIRIEEVEKKTYIKEGDQLIITTKSVLGNAKKVSTSYRGLPKDLSIGDTILVDDGKIELCVEAVKEQDVYTRVIFGGKLKSRKGINLPNTKISAPSLTAKDANDLKFAIEHDIEWVAMSFVRKASDIIQLRKKIEKAGKETLIIAKIEKPEAIRNIDEIINVSDGIMVARGDLGVEIRSEEVPMLQKIIVEKCRKVAKPVIIATQMMESMIENPRPTRAETNDIANAVLDGADTLMLSGETAVGAYPVEVIRSMVNTIRNVEEKGDIYYKLYPLDEESDYFLNDSVVHMSAQLANYTNAKAMIGLTHRGYTAFKLSSYRPQACIFIFTNNKPFINTMNLVWGLRGIYYNRSESTDTTISDIYELLKKNDYVKKGDIIINLAAMPINKPGRVNTLQVNKIK